MIPDQPHVQRYNEFMLKTENKVDSHKTNSRNAKLWHNTLNICVITFSASLTLSMVICSVVEVPIKAVTITSASFGFVLTLLNQLSKHFMFESLYYLHQFAGDNYQELLSEIEKFKYIELSSDNLEKLIKNFDNLTQKHHLQSVRWCWFGTCVHVN